MARILRFQNQSYQVERITSSGLGEQYALTPVNGTEKKTVFLNDDVIAKNPTLQPLMEAALKLYQPHSTLAQVKQTPGT